MIHSLGYVAIRVADLSAWREFATQVLGLMVGDGPEDQLWLRADDRCQRLILLAAEADEVAAIGWETRNDIEFERCVEAVRAAGVAVELDADLAGQRGVAELARFDDGSGNPTEVFWGMRMAGTPFVSPAGVAGFVTGQMGLGHVVVPAPAFAESDRLYRRTLGFGLTDFAAIGPTKAHFLHTNPRHHSLALIDAPRDAWFCAAGLVHIMLQMTNLTDVGRAQARASAAGCTFFETLGEHANDRMVSFYVNSPSGFPFEIGAGAIEVDPATWSTTNHALPDIWGHQILGLPEQ